MTAVELRRLAARASMMRAQVELLETTERDACHARMLLRHAETLRAMEHDITGFANAAPYTVEECMQALLGVRR